MGGMLAAGGGGEGQQDGSVLVGAGAVFFDGCEDGGGFAVGGGDGVVEGLEAPGQGINADCEIQGVNLTENIFGGGRER